MQESHHDNLTGQDGDGENSSVLYKESSELSTNQQDSAYSSLKHSAYSSLDPIRFDSRLIEIMHLVLFLCVLMKVLDSIIVSFIGRF